MRTKRQGMKWMMTAVVAGLMSAQAGFSQSAPATKPAGTAGLDKLFKKDLPVVLKRGVHLDLKGLPPTPDRFVGLLKLFAAARYNMVLIEWEDSFPWTVDQRFRSPTAYILHTQEFGKLR